MNKIKLIITGDMLKEVLIPFLLVSTTSLVIIIITIILVQKKLKRSDKIEKN